MRKTNTPTCKLSPGKKQRYERFTSKVFQMVWFVPKVYDIVLSAWHLLFVKFFPKCYFNKVCFELSQNVIWTDE